VGGGTLNARRNSAKAPSLACVPGDPECRLDVNDWPCFNLNAMELCMKSVFTASVVCTSREISCSSFQPILPRPRWAASSAESRVLPRALSDHSRLHGLVPLLLEHGQPEPGDLHGGDAETHPRETSWKARRGYVMFDKTMHCARPSHHRSALGSLASSAWPGARSISSYLFRPSQ